MPRQVETAYTQTGKPLPNVPTKAWLDSRAYLRTTGGTINGTLGVTGAVHAGSLTVTGGSTLDGATATTPPFPDSSSNVATTAWGTTAIGTRVRWVPYTGPPQTFAAEDMTRDGDWTMHANKATSARPAPQPTGPETDLLPAWTPTTPSARATYTVYNEWTTNTGGWVDQYGSNILAVNVGMTHAITLSVNGTVRDTFTATPTNAGMYWHDIAPIVVASGAVLRVTLQVTQPSGNPQVYWEQQTGLFASAPPLCSLAVGSKDGAAAGTTAYGTHLLFTPGTTSADWDLVAYGGEAAGGGQTGGPAATGAPNKIVNPFLELDQANEGAAVAVGNNLGLYIIDGYAIANAASGATVTGQRVTDAPVGYSNSLRATMGAGGTVGSTTNLTIRQTLEADELQDTGFGTVNAQTLSLAFWVKSSVAGTYSASLRNSTPNRAYVFNFTIAAANTWQRISATIPGDTAGTWTTAGNGVGIYLDVALGVGSGFQAGANAWTATAATGTSNNTTAFLTTSGATFQLGPCGLWVASAPQPLLRTSITAELAKCQRYFEKSYDLGTALGAANAFNGMSYISFPAGAVGNVARSDTYRVTKRASPTLIAYSPGTGATGKVRDFTGSVDLAVANLTPAMSGLYWQASPAATAVNLGMHWTADARL
jgi:hypothetical protein